MVSVMMMAPAMKTLAMPLVNNAGSSNGTTDEDGDSTGDEEVADSRGNRFRDDGSIHYHRGSPE